MQVVSAEEVVHAILGLGALFAQGGPMTVEEREALLTAAFAASGWQAPPLPLQVPVSGTPYVEHRLARDALETRAASSVCRTWLAPTAR